MAQKIKVATVSMPYKLITPKKQEDNLHYIATTVAEIVQIKPDIIVLPEVFSLAWLGEKEKMIGHSKELLCDLAKKNKTYILGTVYEKRKDKIYNTALVINRKGEITGRYDKIHPVEIELDMGIFPGRNDQLPVKTEFGTTGIKICFDANWEKDWQSIRDIGAEIIFFLSAYPGGKVLDSIALLNKVFIVSATWYVSGIIDNTGRWIVKTDRFSNWVWSTIDLERTVFHWDFQGDKIKKIRKKYGDKIKIETFGPEAWFVLEPNIPEISIKDIMKEFSLVTYRDYIKRATIAQDKARENF